MLSASFQPAVSYAAGNDPVAVATADFNGDGQTDIALANYADGTVSVLLGKSDGTFATQATFTVGAGPCSSAAADFNHDGYSDLVVANQTSDSISVLLSNGNGTFQPQTTYAGGGSPSAVATGDFNHDGKQDLAFTDDSANELFIMLGNGNGTFKTPVTYAVGNSPDGLVCAKINGDAKLDIAVVNRLDNTVSVLLGNGNGTFKAAINSSSGDMPVSVAAADLNNDGKMDLVTTNIGDDTVSVLLGNGNGTFQTEVAYSTGWTPAQAVIADFNGDGIPDIATADAGISDISVLLGNGDGTFQARSSLAIAGNPSSLATADFNGDSKPDLVVADGLSAATVLLNNSPFVPTQLSVGTVPANATAGVAMAPVTVTIQNYYGVTCGDDTSTVTLSLSSGTFHDGSTTETATAVAGIATFNNLTIDATGSYTLAATDGTLSPGVSTSFNVVTLVAAQVIFTQPPTSTTAGMVISPTVTITVQNAAGTTIATDNTSTVTLSLSSGTFDGGASNATMVVTGGVAVFTTLQIDAAGTYTITASDGALTTATSASFTISPGAVSDIIFTQKPTSQTAGTPMGSAVILTVQDSQGNTITSDTSTVTLSLSAGTFDGGSSTITAVAVGGVATFNGLLIDVTGNYIITASDDGLTTASTPFAITAGPATQLAFGVQPGLTAAGVATVPAVTVAVQDALGNTVTANTSTVTLTLSSGTFDGGLTTVTAVAVRGVATFNNIVIDTAGNYTLDAGDAALTAATSNSFTVANGGTISGEVFNDVNGNGIRNHRDTGMTNVTVKIQMVHRRKLVTYATTTDAFGNYYFVALPAGTYRVSETVPTYNVQTGPGGGTYTLTVTPGQMLSGNNFGNRKV